LDDSAFLSPVEKNCNFLMLGDSITQGYDASVPEKAYAIQLVNHFNANALNKGIAGEQFFAALTSEKEDFEPDYVVVSYGCNDWNRCAREEFTENCKEFLTNIHKNYSASKVIVIAPIWCKKSLETRVFGSFEDVAPIIREQAAPFDNMSVINGYEFVPQDETYFTDGVHPNNAGFELYFEKLAKAVSKL
jgi:lysophospholipase L1-like esterase